MKKQTFDVNNTNNYPKLFSYILQFLKKLSGKIDDLEESGGPAPVPNLQEVMTTGNQSTLPVIIYDAFDTTGAQITPSGTLILLKSNSEFVTLKHDLITALRILQLPDEDGTLATQGYVTANVTPSQLQRLTEGTTGWRLLNKNPLNYGNIGTNAVDFSESDGASSTRGATAPLSFACNYRTTASGNFAFASGSSTTASGFGAFATGQNGTASGNSSTVTGFTCIASGDGSFATGNGNTSPSGYETVVGMFATNYSPASTNGYSALDRVFNIGNGTVAGARSDAFTVLKNGTSIFGGPARLKTYTVVTLPAGVLGDTAIVTDATAPTYLGALVGGGAVVCPVFYNGTAWVSH